MHPALRAAGNKQFGLNCPVLKNVEGSDPSPLRLADETSFTEAPHRYAFQQPGPIVNVSLLFLDWLYPCQFYQKAAI